jgi:hypothetical protein
VRRLDAALAGTDWTRHQRLGAASSRHAQAAYRSAQGSCIEESGVKPPHSKFYDLSIPTKLQCTSDPVSGMVFSFYGAG